MKLFFAFFFINLFWNTNSFSSNFIDKGFYVIDLKNKIEWLKCPVGMVWQKNECEGKALKLELIQVKEAIKVANEQLGGPWRLPTRLELESLICRECINVKINTFISNIIFCYIFICNAIWKAILAPPPFFCFLIIIVPVFS